VCLQGSNRLNSSMRFRAMSTTIRPPPRVAGFEGTTCPRTQGELRSNSGFTAPSERRAPEASRVLEPMASSGLLQVSTPQSRGGFRMHHVLIMPRPVCNYVHRIVLQFYIAFYVFIPHMTSYFFPVSPLVRVVQYCHRRVYLRYLRFIWGPLVIFLLGVQCC
jgi:hypothetical protein